MNKLLIAVAAVAFASPAMAQNAAESNSAATADTGMNGVSNISTPQFVKNATIGNMFEIQSAKLAERKSKNQQVQKFAKTLVRDHQKAGKELKSILDKQSSLDIKQPTSLDKTHEDMLKQLKSASAAQFNQDFKKMQIDAHQKAIDLFQSYGQNGNNATLQQWATNTVPTLKKHLQMAEALSPAEVTGSVNSSPRK